MVTLFLLELKHVAEKLEILIGVVFGWKLEFL
jgi:hypothetical protein